MATIISIGINMGVTIITVVVITGITVISIAAAGSGNPLLPISDGRRR